MTKKSEQIIFNVKEKGKGELDGIWALSDNSIFAVLEVTPIPFFDLKEEKQNELKRKINEELWMKLISYTLGEIDGHIQRRETFRVLSLFERVNRLMRLMTAQLDILETMSPSDYQAIRLQLGNGSGQESPGFRLLLELPAPLWKSFVASYGEGAGRSIADIYDIGYVHDDAYAVAEAMVEFDELFQKFRANHIYLIHRSIGMGAQSLKGRPVDLLNAGTRHRFFPELWDIRWQMTDRWGGEYGRKRDSISGDKS